jgi:predicted dehydrogenase
MAVRVGFVGAGGMNSAHMQDVASMGGAKIVAICDVDVERAKQRAAQYEAAAYKDYHDMYDQHELDAVYSTVPPFAHGDQEVLAAKKGAALFVEKPVALTMKKANQVAKAIADAGVVSTAGFQDRYLSNIAKLKEMLPSLKPGLVMGYWMGGMPGVHWWRVRAESGGQACEQTIHIFDMARYLFGEVESVHAVASQGLMAHIPDYDVDDASAVNLKFKSGLCGTIFSACFLQGNDRAGLEFWTPTVHVFYAERGTITINEVGAKKPKLLEVKNNPLMDIDKAFITAVKKGDQSLLKSSYADAAKSLEVVLAANKSLETGKVVTLG